MRRRILSVLVCLAALAVMLGLGAAGRRNTADAIGIGVIMGEAVRVRQAPSRTADIEIGRASCRERVLRLV